MTGAESLVRTAARAGVEVCFANPGTTELGVMAALDAVPGFRGVLGLFEGVCTAAADGYARMAGKPALVLLHHGPGLANGLANLHNARRARSPMVVLVGDCSEAHGRRDFPLHVDIAALAAPVCDWVRHTPQPDRVPADTADALAAAIGPPGRIACMIVPDEVQFGPAAGAAPFRAGGSRPQVTDAAVGAVRALRLDRAAAILLGGSALTARGLRAAARISAWTGCQLVSERTPARIERGGGLPPLPRLPYFPELALAALAPFSRLVLAGTRAPVAFFDYPENDGSLVPHGTSVHMLASPEEDAESALEALAEALGAPPVAPEEVSRPPRPSGPLTPETLAAAVAHAQPEGAILVDESLTSGLHYWPLSAACPSHTFLTLCGGAIGWGPPAAAGAAVACPDRPVIALQADGSALYTLQALWTQARERLNVTTILCSNRRYRILEFELARAGIAPGPVAQAMTDLGQPGMDWTRLAEGFGVPASRVQTAESLVRELGRALAEPGPHLIEAMVEPATMGPARSAR